MDKTEFIKRHAIQKPDNTVKKTAIIMYKKNYTKEDLIQLAYNETTVVDSLLMMHCIENDEKLRKEYDSLMDVKRKLDE